ncbi:MAG: DUF4325 domain-containing protein [Candidatus Saelkia tenebricola]|nr:DUF4325 domain-containing protein [Candidatus Saelkia tenebricola]
MDSLRKKEIVKASDIINLTGYSRTYINRFFQKLRDEGKIILIGKSNRARYILATENAVSKVRKQIMSVTRVLQNKDLLEDVILTDIKNSTGIFIRIPKNISDIISYAFLEMLNNAIEHSRSKMIKISIKRDAESVLFNVVDKGVGVYNNIMKKKHLKNTMEAIQDLLKGKQTMVAEMHSGKGIFFTSKVADIFIIQSSHKKLIFNSLLDDVFIKDIKKKNGTKVSFSIGLNTNRHLEDIFKQYTDESFEFSKTKVTVRLYRVDTQYISRSQARRIISGLEEFKTIVLDFEGIEMVGQGFADEIFRVWNLQYPKISIVVVNADENVKFMINRAKLGNVSR